MIKRQIGKEEVGSMCARPTLIKKKTKFSSYITKSRRERPPHIFFHPIFHKIIFYTVYASMIIPYLHQLRTPWASLLTHTVDLLLVN